MEVFFAVLLAKLIGIPGLGGLLSGLFIPLLTFRHGRWRVSGCRRNHRFGKRSHNWCWGDQLDHGCSRRHDRGANRLGRSWTEAGQVNAKQCWRIEGFDGLNRIFVTEKPTSYFGDRQVEEMLRRLACRHLTAEEIIQASAAKRFLGADHLATNRSFSNGRIVVTCGVDPHYVATLMK